MKRTLVRYALLAVFDGPQKDTHLAALGDQLAEALRMDADLISVSAQFDTVEGDVADDDENGLVRFALLQHAERVAKQARLARKRKKTATK